MSDLLWRPLGPEDQGALAGLAEACLAADGGLPFAADADFMRPRFLPPAPGTTLAACDPAGALIAAAAVRPDSDDDPRAIIVGLVHPDHRGRGVGAALMRWSIAQGQALLAESAQAGPRSLEVGTEGLTDAAARLYARHGFAQAFAEDVLRRDVRQPLPDAPLPPDITLAQWAPELAEAFFAAYTASFRERPGFRGWSQDEWTDWATGDDDFRPDASFVAFSGDTPAGFILCDKGWIAQLGVRPEWRGRGLGAALIVPALRYFRAAGLAAVSLGVNVDNPSAARLYTRLGFAVTGRRARWTMAIN
jgi:mycothiol synthase